MVDDSSSDEDNHDGAEEEEEGEKDTCEEESLLWVEEDQSAKDVTATTLDEAFLATLHALPSTARYPVPEEDIEFILVDLQLRGDKVHGTCVELFGRAADGGSVYVLLHGWYPYLYVPAPSGWVDTRANKDCLCLALQEALGSALEQDPLQQHARRILYQFASPIVKVEAIVATSIMGFDAFEEQQLFLKIHVISPLLIAPLRTLLEKQQKTLCMLPHGAPAVVEGGRGTRTFNSNLDPILQFMVDLQLSGCQWCRVPYGQQEEEGSTRSRCRYEVRCGVEALRLLHCETQRSDLGPLRVLSFDLEAAGRKGVFPDPAIDPVIQIAMHTNIEGLQPILLSFQECAPIEGASVLSFEREESLLLGFRDIVLSFDPDILTGYNICNFDLEYLQKRAEALGIGLEFSLMTRVLAPSSKKRGQQGDAERKGPEHMHVRELYFQSAQVGKRKTNRVSLRGRVVLDVYPWMLNNFRLEEYKLDSVCRMYLPSGMTKEDLHFTEITPKWQAGPDGRQELGVYCLKDAELPLALIHALSILFNAVERARVIGIPMEYVLNRGNLVRFTSQLMRESMARGFVLPYVDQASPLRQDATKYKGATVMAVKPGIWENVAVLDFSSMYPSIIIASNLCYSTLYMRGPCRGQPHLRYQGHSFVDSSTRKGVIPYILERMLEQRKLANKAYQKETDPVKKAVLKAREQSIKVLNNGVYGAMGCPNALIPARAVAETTTGIGRNDIQKVKEIAETMFTVERGYPANAVIVGGDTDSVFVKMPTQSTLGEKEAIQEAMDLAHALATEVNGVMQSPKRIAFEKVFRYLLLMKKKRYAGIKYENLTDKPQIDIKGIECVRRDGCPLIRNSILSIAQMLATTADVDAAAQLVRDVVSSVMQDAVPVKEYAIQKVLRKNMQDCAHPMTRQELKDIRKQIESPYLTEKDDDSAALIPLTEAEIDEAIRRGVALRWRVLRKLPHVLVAWKMRLKDPGNAPVLGERVKYVVTLNGGVQISAKAEALDAVSQGGIPVDRHFYLKAFRKAVDGLFAPIIEQRQMGDVKRETERMLWSEMLGGRLTQNPIHQAAKLAQTPIAQALLRAQHTRKEEKRATAAAAPCSKLTMNQAEHTQMKEHVVRKQAEARAKRDASMELSPLRLAFAKQAAAANQGGGAKRSKPAD